MTRLLILLALTTPTYAQAPSLRGTVTDPSGAVIVGATIQLKGPARELRARTDAAGRYAFATLPAGMYQVRITAKGFTTAQKKDIEIAQPQILDTQLAIHGEAQVVIVQDELRGVNASAESNGGRVVLRERQLATLSDDPDELALQLQALAGPAPGPGGGEFFIDGFSGGRLPPKASIREVRINSNPFSPEYDRPGFSRIEVFTKPGSDLLHGQAFAQYNDQRLNARNPLLTQSTRPPYRAQIYSLNLAGPILRNKASFTFDADRRDIRENAFVLATTLDANLNPVAVNQALPAPQTRTTLNPRLDYAINASNSLTVRFQELQLDYDNQGVGDFNLPSRAYNERQSEQTVQATETLVINAQTINELRAQFLRSSLRYVAASDSPAISVLGAFAAGGSPQGNASSLSNNWRYEVQSNLGGRGDWAPRVGIAWGLDARASRPAKTVLRAGFGTFFDRIPLNVTLNSLRYDGVNQQSYQILDPGFFPVVPPVSILEASGQPQQLRPVFAGVQAPRLYQGSVGIERGLNQGSRLSLTWITSRGVHLLNLRNTNAPLQGNYPAGDRSIRLLTESAGLSRLNQLVAGVNAAYRKFYFFGSYTLSYGMANNEGIPADPYNLRAEWSPSSYGDVRHRSAGGTTIPLPRKFSLSAFLLANSGQPYNITTGLDPYATGFPAARPALLPDRDAESCRQPTWKYAPDFGCFDLNPAPGVPTIGRNWARGPSAMNYALRLSHTWTFGPENGGSQGTQEHGPQSPMSVPTGTRKYNIVISASTLNALNHPNFAAPNGVLTSTYFGQYRALGGLAVMSHGGAPSTYNRKIDLQLRFTW